MSSGNRLQGRQAVEGTQVQKRLHGVQGAAHCNVESDCLVGQERHGTSGIGMTLLDLS